MSNFFDHSPAQSPVPATTSSLPAVKSSSSLSMMGYRAQTPGGHHMSSATGSTTPTHSHSHSHGPQPHAPIPIVPVGLDLGGSAGPVPGVNNGGLQSARQSPSPLKRAQSRHFDIDTANPGNTVSKRSSFSSTTSASSVWPGQNTSTVADSSRTTTPYYSLTQGMANLGLGPIGLGPGPVVSSPHPVPSHANHAAPNHHPAPPTHQPAPNHTVPNSVTSPNPVVNGDDELIPTAIVIKNIPFAIKKEQLLDVMTQLRLPLPYAFNYHFDNGVFRGLAFANFTTASETATVIGSLNGREIGGRKLRVEYKKMLPLAERERIERDKRERRGQLEEQHRGNGNNNSAATAPSARDSASSSASASTSGRRPQSQGATQPIMSYPQYSPSPTPTPPPAPKLDLNDPETLEFYSQLLLFRDDTKRSEIVYSHPLLLPPQRQIVMLLCDQLGLIFNSEATGLMVVTRQRQYYEYHY